MYHVNPSVLHKKLIYNPQVAKNNSTKLWEPKNDNWGNTGHPIWGKFGHHHEVNKFMSRRFFLGDW